MQEIMCPGIENPKEGMVDPGVMDTDLEMSIARAKGLETKPVLKMTTTRANMVVLKTNTNSEVIRNLKADMGPTDTSLKEDMDRKEDMNLKADMDPKADTSLKEDMDHKEDMDLKAAMGLAMSTALGLGTLHRRDMDRTTASVMAVVNTDTEIQNVVAT